MSVSRLMIMEEESFEQTSSIGEERDVGLSV
jgi:hypothetical protein